MLSLSLQKQNNLEHCVTKQNKKKGQGQPQTTLNLGYHYFKNVHTIR